MHPFTLDTTLKYYSAIKQKGYKLTDEMMDIYKIGSIEVFFKEWKQYLMLGKCLSTNFDAQIVSLTITLITNTVLTSEKRFNSYQTMGELFRKTQKQLLEFTLWERLNIVILELINLLVELCEIDIDELMERIHGNEQYEKQCNADGIKNNQTRGCPENSCLAFF